MAKLTIIIRGVSLAYLKDEEWRFIFPFGTSADCHKVKFTSESTGHDEVEVAGPGREIIVTTENPSSTAEPGSGFDRFLNLTEAGVTHDTLTSRVGWQQHGVLMRIHNAVVSEHERLRCRWGLRYGNDIAKDYDEYAYSCMATIEATRIFIDIPGVLAQPVEYDADARVEIDNTCGQNHYDSEGDLSLLYSYIIESPDGVEFTMERHPDDDVPVPPLADEHAMAVYKLKLMAKTENPFKYDPGLPCNIYTSERADDLP